MVCVGLVRDGKVLICTGFTAKFVRSGWGDMGMPWADGGVGMGMRSFCVLLLYGRTFVGEVCGCNEFSKWDIRYI